MKRTLGLQKNQPGEVSGAALRTSFLQKCRSEGVREGDRRRRREGMGERREEEESSLVTFLDQVGAARAKELVGSVLW